MLIGYNDFIVINHGLTRVYQLGTIFTYTTQKNIVTFEYVSQFPV